VTTGVLQGDTLAPFLFVVVLDYAMNQLSTSFGFTTHTNPRLVLQDLDFADDIALLDETVTGVQEQHLADLHRNAKAVGLKINMNKTKLMAYPPLSHDVALSDGPTLQQVEDFKYLGSMMSTSVEDLRTRKGQACGVFWSMTQIWRSHELPLALKLNIFDATCVSVLLYGSEVWSDRGYAQNY